jgi:hypothetical protein
MSRATPAITNFTAGEISPRLAGRVDLSKYFNGCERLENFIVHPHGGASRRSGMRFVAGALSDGARSLLIDFEFNTEQTYVIEVGEKDDGSGFMRFFKDQGQILDEGAMYEIESPYGADDFDDLAWVQSNDTLILVHPLHAPHKLTRTGHAEWTLAPIAFTAQPSQWAADNWPSCVCFFESRLVLAGCPNQPNTLWFSRSADFYDFTMNTNPEEDGDPLDDDAIEISIAASHANAIEFLVPRKKLFVGTTGGEWTVGGASSGYPITPSGVNANQESNYGASGFMPVQVGGGALYVQRARRKLREMAYNWESDSFASVDLTILAEHITGAGIGQCAYAQEPDSIVYCVRDDGVLLAFTYRRDQEVLAWSRIVTRGAVESVAAVYNAAAQRDEVWLCVRRTVNGAVRRNIEFIEAPFDSDDSTEAFFLDAGLSYRGEPTTTVAGLDHLVGETVQVLADGATHPDCVVAGDGSVTLTRAASVVHVGLHSDAWIIPMRIEGGSERGTVQTKRKSISHVAVRFYKTLGGRIGTAVDRLETVYTRSSATPMGSAPPLFSDDKRVKVPTGWGRDGCVVVKQDQPLPMTVLMIVVEMVTYE